MTWLNSGTAGNKKSLIMIGADLGYNYSRSGSGGRDTVFSQNICKFVYNADNSNLQASITGETINNGVVINYSITPPGGSFWPDGCKPNAGSNVLYKYTGRNIDDSTAGIGYSAAGYVTACLFLDPRYFTTVSPAGTSGFKSAFNSLLQYVVTNGGLITGVENHSLTNNIPDNYKLSQNYPNPFNPSTKISFTILKPGIVSLKVYDILGKEVATLVNEFQVPERMRLLLMGQISQAENIYTELNLEISLIQRKCSC